MSGPTASGRPGRPPALTVDRLVAAAVAIVDREGLDALSMSKLASVLGVGTMTLYTYVDSKEDLLDRMAASLFEDLEVPSGSGLVRLTDYLRSFRRVALTHPALAQLLAGGRITIPAVFDHLEALIATLADYGLDAERSVRAFFAGLAYTIGFVVWEIPRTHQQPPDRYAAQWQELLNGLEPDSYPILTGVAAPHVGSVASEAQFEWGLDALLSSLRSPPAAP